MPELFGYRDEAGYKDDLKALEQGGNSRGLKENSVINELRYFHCAKTGALAPCIMHDVYSGEKIRFVQCNLLMICKLKSVKLDIGF